MTIKDIKQAAKASLVGNWGLGIGAWWLLKLIKGGVVFVSFFFLLIPFFGFLAFFAALIFFIYPLHVGLPWLFLGFVDKKPQNVGSLFAGFKNFWKIIGVFVMKELLLLMWFLAFCAPGLILLVTSAIIESVGMLFISALIFFVGYIAGLVFIVIKALSYSQATYILKDGPATGVIDAIDESKQLMKGNKGKLFGTYMSFLLWYLPAVVLVFVGFVLMMVGIVFAISGNLNTMIYPPHFTDFSWEFIAPIIIGFILFVVAGIYNFGISFYVTPYFYATKATFYRSLVPARVIKRITEDTVVAPAEVSMVSTVEEQIIE